MEEKKPVSGGMWDERFAVGDYVFGREPNDFLAAEQGRIPPGPVLCLGEGEGRNAVFLAKQGYCVTALDASAVGLEKTRRLAAEKKVVVATQHADLSDCCLGHNAWTGIVSIFCHLPPALRRQVHADALQALQPGGLFLLEAYTPRQLDYRTGGPSAPELLYTAGDLLDDFAGAEILLCREVEREIFEGTLHNGMSATVQFLARRRP